MLRISSLFICEINIFKFLNVNIIAVNIKYLEMHIHNALRTNSILFETAF